MTEQQWREACAQRVADGDWIANSLYAPYGLINWIRAALFGSGDYRTASVERAGACVRAMRGNDTDLPDLGTQHQQGVEGCLLRAMHHALWADDPYVPAMRPDLATCESWLYEAWRQLQCS